MSRSLRAAAVLVVLAFPPGASAWWNSHPSYSAGYSYYYPPAAYYSPYARPSGPWWDYAQ